MLNVTYPDKFRQSLEHGLESKGVNVVLGEFVDETSSEPDSKVITTRAGKKIDADLVVRALRSLRPKIPG